MKPSVNNDDPLAANASVSGCTPDAQKTPVNPTPTNVTHTAGSVTNATGEKCASTRSRRAYGRLGRAKSPNRRRHTMKWPRVSHEA